VTRAGSFEPSPVRARTRVLCCGHRMSATQRLRKSGKVVILWQCQKCRSWLRDDRLMELVVDVVCSELLDPLRAATLERQLSSAFRGPTEGEPEGTHPIGAQARGTP
jgi:hypothetical protein